MATPAALMTHPHHRLARIRRFDQLVAYLRDELDWPIGAHHFDELTFDYTADELGIDARNAAKIQEIKRLRPLVANQPWGVFFVKFAPKRLPVVALRRILSQVEIRTRPQAGAADRPSWAPDDLLFVSSYGDGDHRQIAFAHFSKPAAARDLPTLKVLGWDNLDTPLKLDDVARKLTEHLAWPDDEDDADAWREQWRAAFQLRHGEVIDTSRALSARLAELARAIRDRARSALEIESESGPLTRLMKAFRTALQGDLDADGFADMYAQTIAYGLLSARIADPGRRAADGLAAHMRTNPFLGELMEAFLLAGGQPGGTAAGDDGADPTDGARIDFDELGTSEVVELLDRANMDAVIRDFGDRNPQEDPVIHFYEHFLAAYDKRQKVKRGVFYTPRPVVSYIVRAVDVLLKSEFGLKDGLADTTTWGEMAGRRRVDRIPDGTSPDEPFVRILDPATGTGTFLVEAIGLIHRTMTAKWKREGHGTRKVRALWNDYVPRHLLPRLHGYELLMAPYAIAHLKIGLKLYETGYRFGSDERAQVYLTDALEPAAGHVAAGHGFPPGAGARGRGGGPRQAGATVHGGDRESAVPGRGRTGRRVDRVADARQGVLPSGRKTASYFEVDGKPLGERNSKWLNDLYVRFTRLSQHLIERSGAGVHGFITNHSYIDNPTFRGMRWSLLSAFDSLAVLDLHGNTKKKETAPGGGRDENVFDIEQGVAIGLFVRDARRGSGGASGADGPRAEVLHHDLWGSRADKYARLTIESEGSVKWAKVEPRPTFHLLKLLEGDAGAEYDRWTSVNQIFPVNSVGIVTARDALTVRWSKREIWGVVREMAEGETEDVRAKYRLRDVQDWKVAWAQRDLRGSGPSDDKVTPILYRPFDTRYTYYTGESRGFLCRPRADVMGHMLGENVGLMTCRQSISSGWCHTFATRLITDDSHGLEQDEGAGLRLAPLPPPRRRQVKRPPLQPHGPSGQARPPTQPGPRLRRSPRRGRRAPLRQRRHGRSDSDTFGPEDLLAYIYAVFHSPDYRARYEAHLKLDFPRVPLPGSPELFRQLAIGGHRLLELHLMESDDLEDLITDYAGPRNPVVGRVGWSNSTVWLDAAKTDARQRHRATSPGQYGFHGVPEEVWDFSVGGYQVCHKWLKDRKGRTLAESALVHYQRIVAALAGTIRAMEAIDGVIGHFGGWPGAFAGATEAAADASALKVAEPPSRYEGPAGRFDP